MCPSWKCVGQQRHKICFLLGASRERVIEIMTEERPHSTVLEKPPEETRAVFL
jgi:hypothetical protein